MAGTRGGGAADETGFVAAAKRLRRRFGLNRHRLMERFVVTTAVFAVSGLGIVVSAAVVATADHHQRLSAQAVYTTSFTTSLSELRGSVDGLRRSPDGTRAVVLVGLPSGMAAMSVDAGTYQVFVTGATPNGMVAPTWQRVHGQYVVYGATGQMAVVLEARDQNGSPTPFKAELLAITVRANREISDRIPGKVSGKEADSFATHDQWRMFENPGASAAEVDEHLKGGGEPFDAARFYLDHVVSPKVAAARRNAQERLAAMRVDLERIDEYTDRLGLVSYHGVKLARPSRPAMIAGDAVVRGGDGVLSLSTNTVVPGGYDFTARDDDLVDGYSRQTPRAGGASPTVGRDVVWTLEDGRELSQVRSDPEAKAVASAVEDLERVWSAYLTDKSAYQRDCLGALVAIAREFDDLRRAVTTAADVVKTY